MLRRSEGSLGAGRTRVGATEKAKTPERRGSRCVCFWLPTSPRVTSGVPEAGGIFGVMFEQVYNRSQDVGGRRNLSTPNFPSNAIFFFFLEVLRTFGPFSRHRMAKRWGWLVTQPEESSDSRKEKTRGITTAGSREEDKSRRKWEISEASGGTEEGGGTVQGRESLRSHNVGKSCFYCLKNSHHIKLAMRKSPVRTGADITPVSALQHPKETFWG